MLWSCVGSDFCRSFGINNIPIGESHTIFADSFVADAMATFLGEGLIAASRANVASARAQPVAGGDAIVRPTIPHWLSFGIIGTDGIAAIAAILVAVVIAFIFVVATLLREKSASLALGFGNDVLPIKLAFRANYPRRDDFGGSGD